MRPGEIPGVVAILDTKAECRVLADYFDTPDFIDRDTTELDDSVVKAQKPEFQVRYEDVSTVRDAATSYLRERGVVARVLERWDRHANAAANMIGILGDIKSPDEAKYWDTYGGFKSWPNLRKVKIEYDPTALDEMVENADSEGLEAEVDRLHAEMQGEFDRLFRFTAGEVFVEYGRRGEGPDSHHKQSSGIQVEGQFNSFGVVAAEHITSDGELSQQLPKYDIYANVANLSPDSGSFGEWTWKRVPLRQIQGNELHYFGKIKQ